MADFPYTLDGKLILIPVVIYGPREPLECEFILDTGSSLIVIDPSLTDQIGYSARDASRFSTVSSAVGIEHGYRLIIQAIQTLGKKLNNVEVACHDLKDQGVAGLIGMDFLERFRWCVDPQRQVIAVGE